MLRLHPSKLAFFAFFSILGLRDFFQTRHAILRNYPITAYLRFLFEKIRPEMRQHPSLRDRHSVLSKDMALGAAGRGISAGSKLWVLRTYHASLR
jgi:hypothetical protein